MFGEIAAIDVSVGLRLKIELMAKVRFSGAHCKENEGWEMFGHTILFRFQNPSENVQRKLLVSLR